MSYLTFMDLRHFRTFVTAAELLSFGQAAERLGIAQPAVSQLIKTMEDELGFPLFRRLRRGVELTPAGAAMLPEARATLDQAQRSLRVARSARRGEIGRIDIGYSFSIMAEPMLPALIRRFSAAWPEITLEFSARAVEESINQVLEQTLDVVFVRAPLGQLSRELVVEDFYQSELTAVLPIGHPLAQSGSVSLQTLSTEKLIQIDDQPGFGLGQRVQDLFAAEGLTPRIGLHVDNVTGITGMTAAGMGVGIVPRAIAEQGGAIAIRSLADCDAQITVCMIHRRQLSPQLQRFIAMARMVSAEP
ncbi:LysR family transcriptional regulator [Acidisoma cellulosilytica]|uniref:LysR family transcriptional regulator n=1 Tax=Acidisoma cellulosilyticum TaxID=2802395 RepID=A0A963Z0W7_9PROT|nr:LysR family transcriptional regulator [Acidisoma cellulosilyticum]MCB8879800.1 LysR family transcriptional regulator [Acidisoma cellulosilyticum]